MPEHQTSHLLQLYIQALNGQLETQGAVLKILQSLRDTASDLHFNADRLRRELLGLKMDEAGLDYCSFSPSLEHNGTRKIESDADLPLSGVFPKDKLRLLYVHQAKGDRAFAHESDLSLWGQEAWQELEGCHIVLQVCDHERHIHMAEPELFDKYPLAAALKKGRRYRPGGVYSAEAVVGDVVTDKVKPDGKGFIIGEEGGIQIRTEVPIWRRDYRRYYSREDLYEYFGIPKVPDIFTY